MNFNHIFITADFFRVNQRVYEKHLRKLYSFFSNTIPRLETFWVNLNDIDSKSSNVFHLDTFLAKSNISRLNKHKNYCTYDNLNIEKISEDSINYFYKYIPKESLIIGYELSNELIQFFQLNNIYYIDLWHHPARFSTSALFALRTNVKYIFDIFNKLQLNTSKLHQEANEIVAHFKSIQKIERNVTQTNSNAVFIGQMPLDRAVLKNEHFLSILDFKEEFINIARKYDNIFYIKHPLLRKEEKLVQEFLASIENVKFIKGHAYYFLAQDNIKHIFAISSSVIYESEFFGKQASYLYRPIIQFSEEFDPNKCVSIKANWVFCNELWGKVTGYTPDIDIHYIKSLESNLSMYNFFRNYRPILPIDPDIREYKSGQLQYLLQKTKIRFLSTKFNAKGQLIRLTLLGIPIYYKKN